MGIFDIFKRKKEQQAPHIKTAVEVVLNESEIKLHKSVEVTHPRRRPMLKTVEGYDVEPASNRNIDAIPSKRGLFPDEILVLHYAPSYRTEGNTFQQFWLYRYGINDVQSILSSLLKRGFICEGDLQSMLEQQTIPELKKVLLEHGCKLTGKKSELVVRALSEIPEDELSNLYPHRPYELTDTGRDETKENEYVLYIHRNRFEDLDIWSFNRLIHTGPKLPYRDKIWGYLNERSLRYFYDKNFAAYRNCLHEMASFLSQENKYDRALEFYAGVAYCDLSSLLSGWCYDENYRQNVYENNFFDNVRAYKIYPGIMKGLENCQKKLKCSDDELKIYLKSGMSMVQLPFHPFTIDECVQLILHQRDGDIEGIEEIFMKARKRLW